MPFFLVAAPPDPVPDRVQVWATPFPTREAAAAHAHRVCERCVIVEARSLQHAIQLVRANPAPG